MYKIPPYPGYPEKDYFESTLFYEIMSNRFVIIACGVVAVIVTIAILALVN